MGVYFWNENNDEVIKYLIMYDLFKLFDGAVFLYYIS